MSSKPEVKGAGEPGGETARILVEDAGGRRPFMRGIMVHSLVARGVGFEEAYRTANAVREKLEGRDVVQRGELAKAVAAVLDPEAFRGDPHPPSLPASIQVADEGKPGLPFSKGILSQSLLAAAIDPNDAFDVAREIEAELLRSRVRKVGRHELRRVAYEALGRRIGAQAAERYLVWRKFQEPERPVIVLLGGTSGVGKTSLALEVAHRLGIGRVLSTDSIRQVMRIMLSEELAPAIHASSYEAHQLLQPGGSGGLSDPVLEGFHAQAAIVSVGVRAMLDRAVDEGASLVLDGVSLVPGQLDLDAYADRAEVIFLLVAALEEESFRSRFEARAKGQTHRRPHRYIENLDAILKIQERLLELGESKDVPIIDNVSFDRSVVSVTRHITETLRKRTHFDPAALL